jgi:putative ABC transport system ATP-binding protein
MQFAWQGRTGFALAVDTFTMVRGERLLLVAPSGTGKSTLIGLIAGITRPQKGSVCVLGTDLTRLSQWRRDRFRAEHIGLIFQSLNLVSYLTALENILLPLSFAPARLNRAGGVEGARTQALQMLDAIGLPSAEVAGLRASQLSLGQQQRVAALRALIGAPDLIVADEPTSALDRDRQAAFLQMLQAQLEGTGSSLLMVSHDPSLPGFDRVVALTDFARAGRALA